MAEAISKIKKRSGEIMDFDRTKISAAIANAAESVGVLDKEFPEQITEKVMAKLQEKFHARSIPAVEEIQDVIEETLIESKMIKIAKNYILYRDQRARLRDMKDMINSNELIEGYLQKTDWKVQENSNMDYSLQGLNNHLSSAISSNYWLNKVYTSKIRNAHKEGDIHIHDLQLIAPYCAGWDLKDLLLNGFGGVSGKVESRPPKHFRAALGQAINFLYTLQGEVAGAEAFANVDTYLAPFIRHDNLSYEQVKQNLQEFLYNINIPTRVGFQTPFTNITLDLSPTKTVGEENVIIGGEVQNEKYKDFQEEMDMFNMAFAELMTEGDAKGRVFTFPIPTYNITEQFPWDSPVAEKIFEMTARYGIPYFSNFINSDMDPDDARSMCCRLRLDNRELRKRGGGLFGSNPLTGSIGVVTINMPRLAYLSQTKEEFYERLVSMMHMAHESLETKRDMLERLTDNGLYPYASYFLGSVKERFGKYWQNHFSTVGVVGMNEAALNFVGEDIASERGREFAEEVLDFMREKLMDFQNKTDNLYNLEATPAEGTSRSLAKKDKDKYPDIAVANTEKVEKQGVTPYYTNSSLLPVGHTDDLFEALDLQNNLQTKYTGGTVFHAFIGEALPSAESTKRLIQKIAYNYNLPYFTITPTFSICPVHGYLSGEHKFCPKCDEEIGVKEESSTKDGISAEAEGGEEVTIEVESVQEEAVPEQVHSEVKAEEQQEEKKEETTNNKDNPDNTERNIIQAMA